VNAQAAAQSAKVRELTQTYKAGTQQSFQAFRDLVQLLLGLTVMADNEFVGLVSFGDSTRRVLGGRAGPTSPVRLRDGWWLRVAYSLHLAPHEGKTKRLKVEQTSVQYQGNESDDQGGGLKEVFRYDYLRVDDSKHPKAHINIHASLVEADVLAPGATLARVHFPTSRVSLEAILRLLIVDFKVPTATDDEVWQPVLATSEMAFQEIAHQPEPPGMS
jgi:hypothetical protein